MNADFDPTSIDLARESDFSAGDLKVRPSLRQVESAAGAETLEPRVMQVLVALFQRRGEVVSRDELIQRCWGGRVVGEDAISRAIARVRKLGESTGAFNLETIPKVGYRMMGMTAVGVPDAATPPSPGRWAQIARSPLALPIGIVAVIVIAAAFWLGGQGGQASADAVVERLAEQSQQRASPGQIKTVGAAVQALGASDQSAERSAFDALASGDGIAAINMLEAYAAELEGRGENKQAA